MLDFSVLAGIDVYEVVYVVPYMVWDIQLVVMGVVYVNVCTLHTLVILLILLTLLTLLTLHT